MPQYLPMSAKDYYDPVPGWNFGLGVAQNIERARANRAQEIQNKINEENRKTQAAEAQAIARINAERIRDETLSEINRRDAEARLPDVWSEIASEQQFEPDHNVIAPELQQPGKPRGFNTETYIESARRSGVPLSASILGQLDRSRMSEEVFDPRVITVTEDSEGNPLKEPVQFAQGGPRSATVNRTDPLGFGGVDSAKSKIAAKARREALKSAGVDVSDADENIAFAAKVGGGMSAANANKMVVDNIEGESIAYQMLTDTTKAIKAFNENWGKGAFDEYVGPIDNPVFEFKTKNLPADQLSEADAEAKEIFDGVLSIVQGYRRNNFGTALTQNESSEFKKIVNPPSFASYERSLNNFKNNLKRAVTYRLKAHKMNANVPVEYVGLFLGRDGAEAGSGTTPAASGVVIMTNPQGKKVSVPSERVEEARKNGYR